MKHFKLIAASVAVLVTASSPAWADRYHHGHPRTRVFIGVGPFWDPWFYAPPPVYYPPSVVYTAPPVYIERGDEDDTDAAEPGYWYYCAKSKGYYPYVKQCPGGWQQVAPAPTDVR